MQKRIALGTKVESVNGRYLGGSRYSVARRYGVSTTIVERWERDPEIREMVGKLHGVTEDEVYRKIRQITVSNDKGGRKRFDMEVRVNAVMRYMNGERTAVICGKRFPPQTLYRWLGNHSVIREVSAVLCEEPSEVEKHISVLVNRAGTSRRYSPHTKTLAVLRFRRNPNFTCTAERFGISSSTLHKWVHDPRYNPELRHG